MNTKCKVGNKLSVQVGGDFWYSPPSPWEVSDLLLIGGGVGINPLFSMLQHHVWVLQSPEGPGSPGYNLGAVQLLYSSKTASELLFKVGCSSDVNYPWENDCIHCAVVFMQQQIDQICADCSHISAQYFVTKEECNNKSAVACESDCLSPLGLTDPCNLSHTLGLHCHLVNLILLGPLLAKGGTILAKIWSGETYTVCTKLEMEPRASV